MRGRWLVGLVGLVAVLGLGVAQPAQAAFVRAYATVTRGALTFTGNTVGFDKAYDSNSPGTQGGLGAFMSMYSTDAVTGWNTGVYGPTTLDWTRNGSSAVLRIPAGATVLHAQLIWGGSSYSTFGTTPASYYNVRTSVPNPVTLRLPSGATQSVAPQRTTRIATGNYPSTGQESYVNSAEVTQAVKQAGTGDLTFTVMGIPATIGRLTNYDNTAGWTLAVAYQDNTKPVRNLNIFLGNELINDTNSPTASVSGFCTPTAGPVSARVLVSAQEGDVTSTGDRLLFAHQTSLLATQPLSGTRNPSTNFFQSQICNDAGALDTSGTRGAPNHNLGSAVTGARQSWDITNVDASSYMRNNQNTAYVRGTTNGDQYIINGLGLQIDVGAPLTPVPNLAVDKAAPTVGDVLTYTTSYSNLTGFADALNVVYTSRPPLGLSFIPGSVTVNGATMATADPRVGVPIGTVAVGTRVTVTYKYQVDAVPIPPLEASYQVTGQWDYKFASCPGYALTEASGSAGTVITYVPRIEPVKAASTPDAYTEGQTILYRVSVPNRGTAPTSGATKRDPLPSYLAYVANSTTLNGVAVTDGPGGTFPFEQPRLINSTGQPAGVIAVGATALIEFRVTVRSGAPTPIVNTAYIDPDGLSGPAPEIAASTENPRLAADLAITKTDGRTTMIAGGTTTYTITVTNLGPNTTTAMTVNDALPAALLDPVYSASTGNYDPVTGIWTGLNLAINQSVSLQVTVRLDGKAIDSVTNRVAVFGAPGITNDPNTANNQASDTNTITREADLSVTKDSGGSQFQRGSIVEYMVVVTNHGPTTIDSVYGEDIFPPQMTPLAFEPRVGLINMDTATNTGMWTGMNLAMGEEARMVVRAQLNATYLGPVTNTVKISSTGGYTDPNLANNTASDTDQVVAGPLYNVSGMVYYDAAHNGTRDPSDGIIGAYDLWVKLQNVDTGTVVGATAVHNANGTYTFTNVPAGSFRIILDDNNDLTDSTPTVPPGWIFINPADGRLPITVTDASLYNQDFGLWFGETVAGEVFVDDGAGGGIAANAIRDGAEMPLANVAVSAQDDTGTTFDVAYTDADGKYMLWIPGLYSQQPLRIVEANPTGYISVSGSPGDTGGYYELATDTVFWHGHFGEHHTGVNFGDSAGLTIGGYVYHDLNHNGQRDPGELGLEIAGLYGKGMPDGASAAVQVILVDPATGRVSTRVGPGTYTVLVDNNSDLTDITPYAPPGWIPTENPTQIVTGIVVTDQPVEDINVGFYHGMKVTGRVFEDNGVGTDGIANNGVQDGDEVGLEAVVITAYDSDGRVLATTTTDAAGDWELWVPYTAVSDVVTIVETNPEKYLSTGGRPGDTGGTYDRTTDTLTFTAVWGTLYEGVTFADVLAPTFAADGQQQARPGSMVYYPHTFTTSTAGQVTFSASKVDDPATLRWPEVLLYHDVNGDGLLDDGDTLLTGPLDVARGEEVKILAVVYVPVEAPLGASSLATVSADFVFSNADPSLSWQGQVRDLTTVSEGAGVVLHKAADKETVSPGEIITYTLTYTNNGLEPITDLVLADKTPTYTTFVAAPAPTAAELPATLTGCTLTMPAAGETGEMTWAFAGSLAPGSSGTVTYQVRVDRATP